MSMRWRTPLACLLALVCGDAAYAQRTRPNILVIVADDLGYADVGAYGCTDVPTPNIDSLARDGIRFTDGYVTGPYCSPTRAALLTGRYQQRYGHEFNPGPPASSQPGVGLPRSEMTLADRTKALGYTTALIGKWHLGYEPEFHPLKRGFDSFFGFLGGAHSYVDNADANNVVMRGTEPVKDVTYLTDMLGDEAVAFIERHRGSPWFLYLAFNADHAPMQPPQRLLSRFAQIADPLRQKFAGMHSAMDENVGKVLAALSRQGLDERTVVFFMSDNGGPTRVNASRNDPLRGVKAQTWEGGIRVPFILRWSGAVPAGRTYSHPIAQLDVLPTALTAAGADIKSDWKLDGVNLLPYVQGKQTTPPHDALYWRFGSQLAVRMGDWKLVKAPGAGAAAPGAGGRATTEGAHLYNLASDIGEQTNLAEKEPEKGKRLAEAWNKWNAELQEPKWGPPNQTRRNQR
jgi:arylsulfatase A-like enzyme